MIFINFNKRVFDLFLSICGLVIFSWVILLAWLISACETRSNGFFIQQRIGRYGKPFNVIKIKTMFHSCADGRSSITAASTKHITASGRWLRRFKIDELPQLWNVFVGQMSFVGPRPDVPGYADRLQGVDRLILELRPGITGPASIKYKNEEEILASVDDPIKYNDEVIWPDKVKLNVDYFHNKSFSLDLHLIFVTIKG